KIVGHIANPRKPIVAVSVAWRGGIAHSFLVEHFQVQSHIPEVVKQAAPGNQSPVVLSIQTGSSYFEWFLRKSIVSPGSIVNSGDRNGIASGDAERRVGPCLQVWTHAPDGEFVPNEQRPVDISERGGLLVVEL